ncbi:hypothetical protein EV130_10411 [Rhizobium azibense]|uniref:Uncharacterized protein n=1 Tax=Rhizobium azibense TaxID=1136135 RepID=A0A4V2VBW3_9HYPH|nr:hypothetical protein EV130_10411 [Rhizobium azibense]
MNMVSWSNVRSSGRRYPGPRQRIRLRKLHVVRNAASECEANVRTITIGARHPHGEIPVNQCHAWPAVRPYWDRDFR